MGLVISATFLVILNSCGLEKRVVVTTRGYETAYPNGSQTPRYDLLQDYDSFPRDTIINYQVK